MKKFKLSFLMVALFSLVVLNACSATPPEEDDNVDEVAEELFEDENIKVSTPKQNATIASPIKIEGEARGTMYFEASFPISIYDSNDNELGTGIATAQSDWMTVDFVPFKALITFSTPGTAEGYILFKKDNASGLPENDLFIKMPIKF